jgi:predicted ribosomally synthesized peptide with nif11-like leader
MNSIEEFKEYVSSHPELQAELAAASSPQEIAAIASRAGFSLDLEAFTINSELTEELSDEMLEKVAGGIGPGMAHQGNATVTGRDGLVGFLMC